jgi:hypothetical protein
MAKFTYKPDWAETEQVFETEKKQEVQFIQDMEKAGIPWRLYSGRGMMGRECPAVCTNDDVTYQDILRATTVNLRTDSLGRRTVCYTG